MNVSLLRGAQHKQGFSFSDHFFSDALFREY
jgi:hypothetical protein